MRHGRNGAEKDEITAHRNMKRRTTVFVRMKTVVLFTCLQNRFPDDGCDADQVFKNRLSAVQLGNFGVLQVRQRWGLQEFSVFQDLRSSRYLQLP